MREEMVTGIRVSDIRVLTTPDRKSPSPSPGSVMTVTPGVTTTAVLESKTQPHSPGHPGSPVTRQHTGSIQMKDTLSRVVKLDFETQL